jgi:2-dehydro-3-deoxyphosphogluconate aldolase / (4S)-4-hydroxy-2-oxoglutarate aldolase
MSDEEFASLLRRAKVLPVIRAGDARTALELLARLAEAGYAVAELTATTPGWTEVLSEARWRWPGLLTGVGTVLGAADVRQAVSCGAGFLVSPYPVPEVRHAADGVGVPFIEGGFTPVEVAGAASRGIAKLFPAHVGGSGYLRSLLSVLPGAFIIPTGGIEPGQVADWLRAGALAVGVGRTLDTDVAINLVAAQT